ncbi:stem 28 kDa glycoprotein-like [Senna tora]|uniref:Stem 28 kDa glycoprotein-like n=1 Tax=Senna tora TaxID=362788 RepID=A0A835CHK6_9FABA|nr:stem 28 kDa glycoprotein-like [Senna tora]
MKAFFLTLLLVASAVSASRFDLTYPLRLRSDGSETLLEGITCSAWRYATSTNNIRDWKTVPTECEEYIKSYYETHKFQDHSKAVNREAYFYAREIPLAKDGRDVFIFDVDDTVISNLPYYREHGYGTEEYNATEFDTWLEKGEAPALPETIKLYNKLLNLGFKIVFLTERNAGHIKITQQNLRNVGYTTWHKYFYKGSKYTGLTSGQYKEQMRKQLVSAGYRIRGIIGDQWSDLVGEAVGDRTFKLPNALYYI